MPRQRTEAEAAAGKLISAIQKEWGKENGESVARISENVMDLAHTLLLARSAEGMLQLLGTRSAKQYLGELWVARHPAVLAAIKHLEHTLKTEKA